MNTENEHVWFREQIAVALSGGLNAAERVRFETHAATCDACAAELAAAREMEQRISALFARPAEGLEDRIIARLRESGRRMRLFIHPMIIRSAGAVAAAVVLAATGLAVTQAVEQGAAPASTFAQYFDREIEQQTSNGKTQWDWGYGGGAARDQSGPQAGTDIEGLSAGHGVTETARRAFPEEKILGSGLIKDGAVKGVKANEKTNFSAGYFRSGSRPAQVAGDASTVRGEPAMGQEVRPGVQVTNGDFGAWREERYAWFEPMSLGRAQEGEQRGREVVNIPEQVALTPPAGRPMDQPQSDEKSTSVSFVGDEVKQVEKVAGVALAPPGAQAVDGRPVAAEEIRQPATRKVIRNGQMEFEVDRFDAAFAQVSKLVTENAGYVGTTDSQKLPNGKMKGTLTVRVPPDRLDTLVLQLRGIGDLKSQKLEAQDVSKQYTDLESELRAARAMEERLLQIIKEGKGAIKDLLAAEKELGNWRQKVEKITGEIRYYDNLVALSTLHVTLFERDIQTAAKTTETETIDAGVETVDVEKSRAEALKAIEEAKGRVIQSELKRYDAGQFGATIVAEVPPDSSGPLLDRIRQLGKVARLEVQRKQTADSNQTNTATNAPPRVEKRDTRLNLSLYNLANVAPRTSSTMQLAASDVEAAYQASRARVAKAGGRLISSNISGDRPEQATANVSFDVPAAEADAVINDLHATGDVLAQSSSENPDVQNVTTEKRGFNVALVAAASLPPRQATAMTVEVRDVGAAMSAMQQSAADAGGRVTEQNMSQQRDGSSTGKIAIEAPLEKSASVVESARKLGAVRASTSAKNEQVPAGELARARIEVTFGTTDTIVEPGRGIWATIRNGLSTSVSGLLWSLQLIVIGLCFVLPWALIVWAGWKLISRRRKQLAIEN